MNNLLYGHLSHFKGKKASQYQTHLSFIGGKYNIPNTSLDHFYRLYYKCLINKQELYLIEKVHDSCFTFFLDLDNTFNFESILKAFVNVCGNKYIVTRNVNKSRNYHVHFYTIICDANRAIEIINKVKTSLDTSCIDTSCIDTSVYKTGLRMIGSLKKNGNKSDYYQIYDLINSCFIINPSFKEFKKTIIRQCSSSCTKHKLNVDNIYNNSCVSYVSINNYNCDNYNCDNDIIWTLLNQLSSIWYDNYNHWIKVAFILSGINHKSSRILFHKFSRKSLKYNRVDIDYLFDKLSSRFHENKLTVASLYYWIVNENDEQNARCHVPICI